ncbi:MULTISPECIES: hypothetical protein [Cobetia]|uniref:Lipoprotein n=1 Tax=Cobetia crustatorum TaxID=553385 RepID=A0A558HKQ6_9GAMM|nr:MULTISPECIES: hypothetical protein [Cobetia]TVU69714.1 hypothetical protein FQP86_11460 [Cobetia crustatorum]
MTLFNRVSLAILLGGLLAGCSANTTISSPSETAKINLKDVSRNQSTVQQELPTTSFGNYEFEVMDEQKAPMYGILPLKFNGGYLALDILLFAPGAFFNLREVYPYYEIDHDQGVVRYRSEKGGEWTTYTPTQEEAERARKYFAAQKSASQ